MQQSGATLTCPLCGRTLPRSEVSRHHLVPRSHKGRDWVMLHRICHRKIHSLLEERDLARSYSTIEALRQHPEIRRFVAWVAQRPPHFYSPTAPHHAKRRR